MLPNLGASITPPEATYSTPLIKSTLIISGLASKLVDLVSDDSYLTPAIIFNGFPSNSVSILNWINADSKSSETLSFESIAPGSTEPPAAMNAATAASLSISK